MSRGGSLIKKLKNKLKAYIKIPKEKLMERLMKLYPFEQPDVLFYSFLKKGLKRLVMILIVVLLFSALFVVSNQGEEMLKEGNIIYRPGYGDSKQEVEIKAGIGKEENAQNITLQIEPQMYTLEEFEAVVTEGISDLEKAILGVNLSPEQITDNLELPDMLPETPIKIVWESDKEEIINTDGKVDREAAGKTGSPVVITAVFTYEDYKISHSIGLFVVAKDFSEEELLHKQLLTQIEMAFENSKSSKNIKLPSEIEGKKVFYKEKQPEKKGIVAVFLFMGVLVWFIVLKEEIEKEEKKRERQLLKDYPELISQFTLLLSAGMTVSGAWKKLTNQYANHQKQGNKKRNYVYEEMLITCREIQNGMSEIEAVNRFGNRIKLTPYLKFASLLSQNIRKGSRGLTELLREEGKMAYEERKEYAKQQGEEAGTKLLLPMIIMLGIVLVIILVPAFLSF